MKKKIILIIIIFLIMIKLIYLPTKVNKSMSICTLDGVKSEIAINISWHKSFFSQTKLKGIIILDGIEYVSLFDTNIITKKESNVIKFQNIISNKKNIPWFVIPKNYAIDIHNDFIQIMFVDKKFDIICFLLKQELSEDIIIYYGPANTMEEAKLLYDELCN